MAAVPYLGNEGNPNFLQGTMKLKKKKKQKKEADTID